MALRSERIWAAAAHLAVLLGVAGVLVSGAILLYARGRPIAFTAEQAGQAAAYQAALALLMIALGAVGAQAILGGLAVDGLRLGGMAYGAFAAFAALDGRHFQYVRAR